MIRYEDECVGCTSMGLRCIGRSCRNRHVPHYCCDKCGVEGKLFHFNDDELCAECIIEELNTETSEYEYDEYDVSEEFARVEGS